MALCLTLLECASIQGYVFASNRLREAIGGSFLVKQATDDLLYRVLVELGPNAADVEGWKTAGPPAIFMDGTDLQAEVLYVGGGNAAVLFIDRDRAVQVVRRLSSLLLACAPGLSLLAAHAEFAPGEARALRRAFDAAAAKLGDQKTEGRIGLRREGLAVTRACATTGGAATIAYAASDGGIEWLSAAAAARRQAAADAESAMRRTFAEVTQQGYHFPLDLDDLGGREGESHLAVVHIDGNGIGQRLLDTLAAYQDDNWRLVAALRTFSRRISTAADRALQGLLDDLIEALPRLQEQGLSISWEGRQIYFPFRPLLYGGDDLTFVCDGRLGLPLAARYLDLFSRETDDEGKSLSACAGVAIARTHFPLVRAYRLSEELCQQAKHSAGNPRESSWLDFHVIFGGLTDDLTALRDAYPGLYWRPWQVDGVHDAQGWPYFRDLLHRFQHWPRTQVKGLRDAIEQGPERTREILEQARLRDLSYPDAPKLVLHGGWAGGKRTPLYDPIEALDFFLDVEDAHATVPARQAAQ